MFDLDEIFSFNILLQFAIDWFQNHLMFWVPDEMLNENIRMFRKAFKVL